MSWEQSRWGIDPDVHLLTALFTWPAGFTDSISQTEFIVSTFYLGWQGWGEGTFSSIIS